MQSIWRLRAVDHRQLPRESQMDMMADTLTRGIIVQFPKSFRGGTLQS
jgi:hypothetical protein